MTLSSELLPAMQHYALLAAALALFSLSLTHLKKRFSVWLWLMIVMLPITQMAWSLWETVVEVAAVGRPSGRHLETMPHGLSLFGLCCTAWRF